MPRGVRLSQEEKDRRAAIRAAKGLAPLLPYVRKFGPSKRPKSAEEKALIKANKDEKKLARNFAKLEKQMKAEADFALLRTDPVAYQAQKKAERKAKSDARKYYGTSSQKTGILSTPRAPRAPRAPTEKSIARDEKKLARNFAKLEKQMKAEADFALFRTDPVAYQAQKKAERKAKSDARKYYGTSSQKTGILSTPSAPRTPRASKPDFIGPLTKGQTYYRQRKLRALQILADTIPLPTDASRRVRVLRQYDAMGRPRLASIRSQLANQAM